MIKSEKCQHPHNTASVHFACQTMPADQKSLLQVRKYSMIGLEGNAHLWVKNLDDDYHNNDNNNYK